MSPQLRAKSGGQLLTPSHSLPRAVSRVAALAMVATSGVVAGAGAGIAPAQAASVPAPYTAAVTADGIDVDSLSVLGSGSLASLSLGRAAGTVASGIPRTSSTASNADGSVLGLNTAPTSVTQTAPGDHRVAASRNLLALTAPGLLAVRAGSGSALARFGTTSSCLPAGIPLSATTTTLAGAAVAPSALGLGAPLVGVGALTTTTGSRLASIAGPDDPRAMQADAAVSVANTSVLDGALTVGVSRPVTLRATASGRAATSHVGFVDAPTVTVTGAGAPITLAAGQTATLPTLDLGGLLTGAVTVTAGSVTTTTNTGAAEAGTAFAYRITVAVRSTVSEIASARLTVGELSVAAGVPATGLQCHVAAPVITRQPGDRTIDAGARATFTVACSDTTTVRWQRAGRGSSSYRDIPGADRATYTTPAEAVADSGARYRAVCTGPGGSVTSRGAVLTVRPAGTGIAPRITREPVGETVFAGRRSTFTAAASGSPTPTVQWQHAASGSGVFTDIPGAHARTYSTPPLPRSATGGRYRAVFRNAAGSATTRPATATVRTLHVTRFLVPKGIRVGAARVSVPFTVETNGPAGAVTVRVVRVSTGATLASTTVAGGTATQVHGAVHFGITSAKSYGAYRWIVTIGNSKGTTLTQPVQVQANALLVAHASRSGATVTLTGRARRWDVAARTYQWWSGQQVTVQEDTGAGWHRVTVVTTGSQGQLSVRLTAPTGARFRLIVHADGMITGRTSNTVTS